MSNIQKYTSIPRDNLAAEFLLDGNANDTSGNGNDGTATDVTWEQAIRGYVSKMATGNQSTTSIDIPNNLGIFSSDFAISFMHIPWSTTTGEYYVDMWGEAEVAFRINRSTNGTIEFEMSDGTVTRVSATISLDTPQFVIGQWDSSATQMELFVDNVSQGAASVWTPSSSANDSRLMSDDAGASNTSWSLGIVRFYSSLLNETERSAEFQEQLRLLWNADSHPALFENLVGYWDFRGDASDVSGKGNDGTVNGATLTTDHLWNADSAYSFDGNDDYIKTGSLGNFGSWAELASYLFWFKHTTTNANKVIAWVQYSSNAIPFELKINHDTTGNFRIYIRDEDNNVLDVKTWDISANDWNWHSFAVVVDSANNNIDMYKDWNSVSLSFDTTENPDNFSDFTYDFMIGDRNVEGSPSWNYYPGDVSEFMIFDTNLSPDKISAIHELTKDRYIYPFAKYSLPNLEEWKVLEISRAQSGGIYYDQSGNGNNGTPTNVTDKRVNQSNVMEFNGTDSLITFSSSDFSGSSMEWGFSILSWIKPQDWTNRQWLIGKMSQANNSVYWINLNFNTSWYISVYIEDWTSWISEITPFVTWEWIRIILTWEPNWQWKVYKNWVEVYSKSSGSSLSSSSWNFVIWGEEDGRYYDWFASDSEVYHRVLSPVEALQDYYSSFIPN